MSEPLDLDGAFPVTPVDLEQVILRLRVQEHAPFDLYVEAAVCLLHGEGIGKAEWQLKEKGVTDEVAAEVVRETQRAIKAVTRRSAAGALVTGCAFLLLGCAGAAGCVALTFMSLGGWHVVAWGLFAVGLVVAGHGIRRIIVGLRRLFLG